MGCHDGLLISIVRFEGMGAETDWLVRIDLQQNTRFVLSDVTQGNNTHEKIGLPKFFHKIKYLHQDSTPINANF